MNRKTAQAVAVVTIFLGGLLVDQLVKIWVKTHMTLHESIRITDWFYITFIENNGMAFGMQFFDKLFLTGFRIIATMAVAWYITRLIRRGIGWGYILCMAFIMTGAAGNIIDCLFYGLIFSPTGYGDVSHFVPFGEGYSTWFYGRVVDMLSFPLWEWDWPTWLPIIGGDHCVFFSYIFNVADACISCGVMALLLFFRRTLATEMDSHPATLPTDLQEPSEA